MQHMAISSAARTHRGAVREANEDAVLARDDLGLWAVADGMGGHDGGGWASATLIEALTRLATDDAGAPLPLDRGVNEGHVEIVRAAASLGRLIGTTVAAMRVDGGALTGVWVGDSRIYRLREGRLARLTRDHSVVQELVDRGALSEEEATAHPMANMLSRAVGIAPALEVDRFDAPLRTGDVYLICSDGLSRVLSDERITRHLRIGDPALAADALLADTLAAGAPDNVSVVVIRADGGTAIGHA